MKLQLSAAALITLAKCRDFLSELLMHFINAGNSKPAHIILCACFSDTNCTNLM